MSMYLFNSLNESRDKDHITKSPQVFLLKNNRNVFRTVPNTHDRVLAFAKVVDGF